MSANVVLLRQMAGAVNATLVSGNFPLVRGALQCHFIPCRRLMFKWQVLVIGSCHVILYTVDRFTATKPATHSLLVPAWQIADG